MQLVANVRPSKFTVNKMALEDFTTIAAISQATVVRKKNVDGEQVRLLHIRCLKFARTQPLTMMYRYSNQADVAFETVKFQKSLKASSQPVPGTLGNLYSGMQRLPDAKVKDLLSLLPLIPQLHHHFYLNLLTDGKDASVLCDQSLDDEDESTIGM